MTQGQAVRLLENDGVERKGRQLQLPESAEDTHTEPRSEQPRFEYLRIRSLDLEGYRYRSLLSVQPYKM
jgi:hypothetical protein